MYLNKTRKKLESLANTDSLTQIFNRRQAFSIGEKMLSSAHRHQTPLSLAVIDIDHFKRINDNFGHSAGDTVLKEVAQTINTTIRESDVVGRIGGEEFVVILDNTDKEQGLRMLKRTSDAISKLDIEFLDKEVTVCAGIAQLTDEESINELFFKADIALYEGKSSGRNKVIVFTHDTTVKN